MAPAAAVANKAVGFLFLLCSAAGMAEATWCVARSDASEQALQTALDYACGSGADCTPIQSSGLCYLPNTVQAHASYAFNSYFQRKGNAPGSCSFAGVASVATTDPSYGSCVYPSSPSNAGGIISSGGTPAGTTTPGGTPAGGMSTPGTTPALMAPPPPLGSTTPLYGTGGGLNPVMGPAVPDYSRSFASSHFSMNRIRSLVVFLFIISVF